MYGGWPAELSGVEHQWWNTWFNSCSVHVTFCVEPFLNMKEFVNAIVGLKILWRCNLDPWIGSIPTIYEYSEATWKEAKRQAEVAFLPVLREPLRIFCRKYNSCNSIHWNGAEENGVGKWKGKSEHWASSRCCEEGKSEASLNGSVPCRKKGAVGKENWWGHYHGNGDEREMHSLVGQRIDMLLTAWECAKELMLRCAVELADVRIPVQICCSFQARDFLQKWTSVFLAWFS